MSDSDSVLPALVIGLFLMAGMSTLCYGIRRHVDSSGVVPLIVLGFCLSCLAMLAVHFMCGVLSCR